MKKKLKLKGISILMAILMIATIIPIGAISSFALTSGDYDYSVISETDKTAEITRYNGTGGDITIPSKIDEYTVTGIYEQAFDNCTGLKSIIIADSITSIGFRAFSACTGLTGVTIPDGVTSIGESAFGGCTSLTAINVSEGNMNYSSIDGVVYNKDKTMLFTCPNGKSGELIIPNGVISISEVAFEDCTGLKDVTIPSSVTTIGEYAFASCTGLKGITIPDSVTSIGGYAFLYTPFYDLLPDGEVYFGKVFYKYKGTMPVNTEIIIKPGTISISDAAFYRCPNLKRVTIPDSITSMGDRVFSDCISLESVSIGNSLTNIGAYAFLNCTSITDITIPDSVTSIGFEAFSGCTGLKDVTMGDSVAIIGWSAFSNTPFYNSLPDGEVYLGKVFYKYKGTMPADTKIDVKDGTLSIAAGAFHGCKGLKSVIIPNSVTDIGGYAFMDCTGLKSVTIPSSVKIIDDVAFGYYYNDGGYEKLPEFTITGIKGSAAEIYAIKRQIKFQLILALGDVNGDGRVTSADAIAVLRAEAQLRTLTAEEFAAADVVKDNRVTSGDAIRILRYEAQLVDKL